MPKVCELSREVLSMSSRVLIMISGMVGEEIRVSAFVFASSHKLNGVRVYTPLELTVKLKIFTHFVPLGTVGDFRTDHSTRSLSRVCSVTGSSTAVTSENCRRASWSEST